MIAVTLSLSCRHPPPSEPDDVDLSLPRAGFHCGAGASGDAADACRVLDEFERAGPVRALPTGTEVQVWLGVDHCVQPTVSAHFVAQQLVYLRAGRGSPPAAGIPPSRVLEHAAVFASTQTDTVAMPDLAAALGAMARGEVPNPATTGDVWRAIPRDATGAYYTLVRTRSGRSIGDGTAHNGLWFLRSDGNHLLLVSPRVQGGCASRLFRVPPV